MYEQDVGTGKDPDQVRKHLERKAAIYHKIRCVRPPSARVLLTLTDEDPLYKTTHAEKARLVA